MFSETEKKIILETKEIIKEKVSKEVLFEKEYFSEMKLYNAVLNKTKIYLSGGAISSIIQNTTPKDWDLYFSDTPYRDLLVKRTNDKFYHLVKIEENHYSDDVNAKNPNAITMTDDISFVLIHSGAIEEIKKTFDYVHCTSHYDIMEDKLFISPLQFRCMKEKLLVQNKPEEQIKEWRRAKFLSKGYKEASLEQL
jgi:hypothetical protein